MTITRKLSPVIGFHGCDRSIAEKVLAGNSHLNASENTYDWLGSGIYFWVDSFARAYDWAKTRKSSISDPYVIGAIVTTVGCSSGQMRWSYLRSLVGGVLSALKPMGFGHKIFGL